jgi:histidinol-phosphate aminotransferase
LSAYLRKTHGGLDYSKLRESGLTPEDVLDFSVSINPVPVHESILNAVRNCSLVRYPDSGAYDLRKQIALHENCSVDEILAVNGTSQGIHLIGEAFLDSTTAVLIVSPAYSQYKNISHLKKSKIVEINCDSSKDFKPDVSEVISSVRSVKPAILWICNPNNPTGTYIGKNEMNKIREAALETNTIVVIDEAYVAFTNRDLRYNEVSSNVLRLNSMTKDYGIPGLRLGYIHGDKSLLDKIAQYQPEWSLSAPAQKAGIACLKEIDYYSASWKAVKETCETLRNDLMSLGLKVYETEANFFMVQLGNRSEVPDGGSGYASILQKSLEKKNMQIRDCSSFGYPDHIRIGVHSEENNRKLFEAIKEETHLWA